MHQRFPRGEFVEELHELMKKHGISPDYLIEQEDGTLQIQIPAVGTGRKEVFEVCPCHRSKARLMLLTFVLAVMNGNWGQL